VSSTMTIGTAPDSWGVWFPHDPEQLPASQFLKEVAEAGLRLDRAWPLRLPAEGSGELKDQLDGHGLGVLGRGIEGIIEHDLYPCAPDIPLPIAKRTKAYLSSCSGATIEFGGSDE
jgi:hypothetical protein